MRNMSNMNPNPMHRFPRSIFATLLTLAMAFVILGGAFPTPSAFPTRWQLRFEPGEMRLHVDDRTGDAYWWMPYKVSNYTGTEQYWAPRFVLYTDQGEILDAGQGVPIQVERELLAMLRDDLVERQTSVIGKIFVGEPNALEAIVVWPADSLNVTEMSLFVSGISGETTTVTDPISGEEKVMQKTFQRDYLVPGDPLARGTEPAKIERDTWVMR